VALNTLREAAPRIQQTLKDVQQIAAAARTETLPLVNRTIEKAGTTAETFTETGKKFGATADQATGLVTDVRGNIKPIISAYYGVADSAIRMLAETGEMFGSSKADFHQSLANLRSMTGTISEKMPAWSKRIDEVLANVDSAVVNATAAITDIKSTMATANDVITGNKSRFDGMIKHLNAAATNIELFTAELSARPWRLLYSPKAGEVENLVLFNAARDFAQGASDLSDAARALRDAVNSPQVDREKVQRVKDELNKSFENFTAVEQKLWQEVRKK